MNTTPQVYQNLEKNEAEIRPPVNDQLLRRAYCCPFSELIKSEEQDYSIS